MTTTIVDAEVAGRAIWERQKALCSDHGLKWRSPLAPPSFWDGYVLAAQAALTAEPRQNEDQIQRIKNQIDYRLNNFLCEMKPGFDDSITGFNEAWDIVTGIFKEEQPMPGPAPDTQGRAVEIHAKLEEARESVRSLWRSNALSDREYYSLIAIIDDADKEATALERQLAEARERLKPFAEIANRIEGYHDNVRAGVQVWVSDIRRAHAWLKENGGET